MSKKETLTVAFTGHRAGFDDSAALVSIDFSDAGGTFVE
jgi:hypothetical protein